MSQAHAAQGAPRPLQTLVGRYDGAVFEPRRGGARVRLAVAGGGAWDVLLESGGASFRPPMATPTRR